MTDISCGNLSAKNLSIVDGIPSANIRCDVITASAGRITSGNVSDAFFGDSLLESSYNHYAMRQLSNGRTFINSYGQNLTFRKTDLVTTDGKTTRTIGEMTFDGTILSVNKLKFTYLDVTNGPIDNLNISFLTMPDGVISTSKITNLYTSLVYISTDKGTLDSNVSNLSNNKQNIITLLAGTGNSRSDYPNNSWTINYSSSLAGTNNISVFNSSINLATIINVSNINLSTLIIPNSTISKIK